MRTARGCYLVRAGSRRGGGCEERLDFAAVTGMPSAGLRTISEFRKRGIWLLSPDWSAQLLACFAGEAGLVLKLGHVALDGTKAQGPMCRGSTRRELWPRMKKPRGRVLAGRSQRWAASGCSRPDKAEDRQARSLERGDEMPRVGWPTRRRGEKIRTAKASAGSRSQAKSRHQKAGRRMARARGKGRPVSKSPGPHGRAERQGTTQLHDPDRPSVIADQKTGFIQGLQNGQGRRKWRPSRIIVGATR